MTEVRATLAARFDPGELQTMLASYQYGRYLEDRSLSREGSQRLLLDQVQKLLSREDGQSVAAYSPGNELLGFLLFKLSAWDTEHFGYNVVNLDTVILREMSYDRQVETASALIERFLEWCRSAKIRFASIRIPVLDLPVLHGFEQAGFHYIESWLYVKHDMRNIPAPAYEVRLARPEDCKLMVDYSKGAFVTHRFYADHRFGPAKADALYEKWIQSSFEDPKQQIFVHDLDDKPAAFMICFDEDLRAYFGLRFTVWKMALLDPAKRNQGLAGDFYFAVMHKQREAGIAFMDSGVSLRNMRSLSVCVKLNFKFVSTVATYHKWLDG